MIVFSNLLKVQTMSPHIKLFTSLHSHRKTILSLLALCLPITLLYGQFLWNPIVFDDKTFFQTLIHNEYTGRIFSLNLRWLPYATFMWTFSALGADVIWSRLGNLALHLATAVTLFLFLRRLFELVLTDNNQNKNNLSPHWLAFFAALIFALHPVSVYAVAYLIQRTTLMATLFTLFTWRFFLEGLIRENRLWLIASATAFLFAVLSKEHAIMAPAVTIILLFLINKQSLTQSIKLAWPAFILYGMIGAFVVFQVKASHILGQSYEPMASTVTSNLGNGFDASQIYPLSIITQSFLFFKYIWLWIIPSPASMSVDMYQDFALRLWSWPQTLGFIAFIIYPVFAIYLLLQRGVKGLLGFALLCPWLLFATELSTVRIQESFVLYRSYLWMAGAFAALPFICQKLSPKQSIWVLLTAAFIMLPASYLKLETFSHGLLLWDDAARLVESNQEYRSGMERIFYNRGNQYKRLKMYPEAISDYTKAIKLGGESCYVVGYAYGNRGAAYLESHQYVQALSDFDKAINHKPKIFKVQLDLALAGRALAIQKINEKTATAKTTGEQ